MGDQVEIITQKEPNPSRDWFKPNVRVARHSRASLGPKSMLGLGNKVVKEKT